LKNGNLKVTDPVKFAQSAVADGINTGKSSAFLDKGADVCGLPQGTIIMIAILMLVRLVASSASSRQVEPLNRFPRIAPCPQ